MRKWLTSLATLILSGCIKGPYNLQVEAEIRDGPVALQLLRYEKDTYFPHPHVGGHSTSYAIVVRDDKNGRLTWLSNPAQRNPSELKKRTFRRSSVSGEQVVYFPIAEFDTLTPDVSRTSLAPKSVNWTHVHNSFVFRRRYGDAFTLATAKIDGAPFVVAQEGDVLSDQDWIAKRIDVESTRIVATEYALLIDPIWKKVNGNDIINWDTRLPYLTIDDDRSGCPDCEPILKRIIVSDDDGMTWHLASYEVLRPLPEGSIVRGDDYYYDEKLKKVLLKSVPVEPKASSPK